MNDMKFDAKREILVIFSFFCMAALTTYPLILKFTSHVAHDLTNDAYYHLWSLWWSKTALFDLHSNPLYTNWHFYPHGTSLIFGTQFHGTGLLASPLQLIFPGLRGLIIEYNFIVFFSLIASAYGTYLLAKHICGHGGAAFVAGIIYAFVPLRMFNMVRLQYFSLHWIPFFILFFIKTIEEDKKRNPVLAAVLFSLILVDFLGYGLDMVFFGVLAVVLAPIFRKQFELAAMSRRLAVFVIAVVILTLPYTVNLFKEIKATPNVYSPHTLGISLESLAFPPFNSTIYGVFAGPANTPTDLSEARGLSSSDFIMFIISSASNQSFIRYSVMLLLLYSLYLSVKFRRSSAYWIVIAAFYFSLSLGPRLVVSGTCAFDIPTPYSALSFLIPPLKMARTTGEYVFHFMLAAAVICSVGLAELLGRLKSGVKGIFATAVVALVVLTESLVIPLDLIAPEISMAYEIIKSDSEDFTVLELPPEKYMFLSRQFLFQTHHQKKLLDGLSVRIPAETRKLMESPFVKGAQNPSEYLNAPPSSQRSILEENKRFFELTKLKYVVVNKTAYAVFSAEFPVSESDLERFLNLNGLETVFEDEKEILFKNTMTAGQFSAPK